MYAVFVMTDSNRVLIQLHAFEIESQSVSVLQGMLRDAKNSNGTSEKERACSQAERLLKGVLRLLGKITRTMRSKMHFCSHLSHLASSWQY